MAVTWQAVRADYEYITEFWDEKGTKLFKQSVQFANTLWKSLQARGAFERSATAGDTDVKFWILTIAFLWRAYLLDWGANHPVYADDWNSIADWVGVDAWFHFGLPTDREDITSDDFDEVLAKDLENRALEVNRSIDVPKLLWSMCDSLQLSTSIVNMESVLQELDEKERAYLRRIRPTIASASHLILSQLRRKPQDVYELRPRAFEELIAEILANSGYDIKLTPQTRDGGYDILAYYACDEGEGLCLVETKRYKRERRIGVGAVRSLYGALKDKEADRAMLVSTSGFSRDALAFQSRHPYELELKEYSDVFAWLRKYGNWTAEDSNSGETRIEQGLPTDAEDGSAEG